VIVAGMQARNSSLLKNLNFPIRLGILERSLFVVGMENRFFAKKFYVAYMSYELFLEELREQSATSNYKKI